MFINFTYTFFVYNSQIFIVLSQDPLIKMSFICEKAKQETGPVCPFKAFIKSPVFKLQTNILYVFKLPAATISPL